MAFVKKNLGNKYPLTAVSIEQCHLSFFAQAWIRHNMQSINNILFPLD